MQPATQENVRQAEDVEVDLMQLRYRLWAGWKVILAGGGDVHAIMLMVSASWEQFTQGQIQ